VPCVTLALTLVILSDAGVIAVMQPGALHLILGDKAGQFAKAIQDPGGGA